MVIKRVSLAKVLVAGASNVGKTSLVNSLIFEGFIDVTPTIGVNFAQKLCYGETGPLNLSIWDLSGQQRFRCLMPRFCQGTTGVVLVFDVTQPQSLEAARLWLEYISSWQGSRRDFAVVLAGNKVDCHPNLTSETIQTFCTKHQISDYYPCSAKSGKNVQVVFRSLCSAIQRRQLGYSDHTPRLAHSSLKSTHHITDG